MRQISEANTRAVLQEKVFLDILQNSLENTCNRVSFLIKLQANTSGRLLLRYPVSTFKDTLKALYDT